MHVVDEYVNQIYFQKQNKNYRVANRLYNSNCLSIYINIFFS